MKEHDGDIRGFYHLSEAWYGPANLVNSPSVDEVTFGHFYPDGGTTGEMSVKWYELGGKLHPRLECFDDAWHSLSTFTDLIAAMGTLDDTDPTPKQFCALLTKFGFKDMTPRKNPYCASEPAKLSREAMLENALGAMVDAVNGDMFGMDLQTHIRNATQLLGRK